MQLSGSRQAVVMQSSGSRQAVVRHSSGIRQAFVRHSSGSRQAIIRQSSGSRKEIVRQSSSILQVVVRQFNLHWHELWKQEKCSSLVPSRSISYKTQWPWQGVKFTRLMSIFTSKKVWNFWWKFSWQNLIQKVKGNKSILPHAN